MYYSLTKPIGGGISITSVCVYCVVEHEACIIH